MNPQEAYKILEVSEDISDDALKAKYKELAKKYHPDIYKDPDKFKKINEAYQLIQDFKKNPDKYRPQQHVQQHGFWNSVVDLGDIFFNNDFFRNDDDNGVPLRSPPINLTVDLTFQDAVKGCSKEVAYTRSAKCEPCNGSGSKRVGNGCKNCNGFGQVTQNNRGMIFQAQCNLCHGKGVKKNKCESCNGKRVIDDAREGNVNIPPGAENGMTLRLAGEGNFIGKSFMHDTYSDVNLKIKVEPYKEMSIKNNDVCSSLSISLLEALEGKTLEIDTVYGNKEITVPAKTRHSDQIKIPKCGVSGTSGMHVVTVNVEYPSDISNIVGVLKDAVHNQL